MKRTIPISKPVTGSDEWEALKEPIMSGWLTSGPKVRAFEDAFAKRHKVKHAIAVTSATTALHLALVALEIKKDDEVIVPAFTWVSTANVVLYQGAKVVFCDIDPTTFNLDPKKLKDKITSKTKAIMVVHLFGLCAPMDEIKNVSGNIPLIEDAACASGSEYKEIPAGGLGLMGCFSFHPRKLITTGEGGMITTNDEKFGSRLKVLRNHGASISEEERHSGPKPFILSDFNELGYNYRMTDLQGAIGEVQLKKLDSLIEERNKWANFYNRELEKITWLNLPTNTEDCKHAWQSYVILVDETKSPFSRNTIMELLQEKGISTRPGTHAIHMLGYYSRKNNFSPQDFPGAQIANDYSISIPLHNNMEKDDFKYIVNTLKSL
jgi:perosamine synthetase|tara:strand:+ start:2438 stop:3574 length:1137 start_codon:yes stop_codon:yes gene_type:complete